MKVVHLWDVNASTFQMKLLWRSLVLLSLQQRVGRLYRECKSYHNGEGTTVDEEVVIVLKRQKLARTLELYESMRHLLGVKSVDQLIFDSSKLLSDTNTNIISLKGNDV
jgi:hypothetical protein